MCLQASENCKSLILQDKFLRGGSHGLEKYLNIEGLLEMQILFEILTCDPSIYKMHHPKFIVSNQKEESIKT